ncbi:hypothetical protein ES332_A10G186800v1 [Gossypium tomentosum]|uniref:Uncharacterized protein n=1 Tax=Gossypium tomentosum TaxID=34277 RepID=A0A5D2NS72_GOSTO|nr:hypothetical protein ES332_A10G186800v1 [Gossypium tomentosum]
MFLSMTISDLSLRGILGSQVTDLKEFSSQELPLKLPLLIGFDFEISNFRSLLLPLDTLLLTAKTFWLSAALTAAEPAGSADPGPALSAENVAAAVGDFKAASINGFLARLFLGTITQCARICRFHNRMLNS